MSDAIQVGIEIKKKAIRAVVIGPQPQRNGLTCRFPGQEHDKSLLMRDQHRRIKTRFGMSRIYEKGISMSRIGNRTLMIADSNQGRLPKMSGCGLQEATCNIWFTTGFDSGQVAID